LRAGGRNIDDGESPVTESDAGFGVDEGAFRVGSAMHNPVGHAPDKPLRRKRIASRLTVDEPCYSAHGARINLKPDCRASPARTEDRDGK